ncbi:hypothetical protein L6164_004403 [Bauhinia variegata]|uniref:Uncharacterized protein n=1 Tax=Bauhinia variegata TaxID=167791 RepID=A0ACB9Q4K5_BAUVA|nr:hypothetical protein L6164_004403 [Bauhinia variegata]
MSSFFRKLVSFKYPEIRMFEGLFKPKFYSKCKKNVNCIKTRLDIIRKKKSSVQKYLKNDIAELLRLGLDINAYGRAEGLLVEQNMLSCYNFVEKFNECISNHLEDLSKQRDCPDECKEAVQSLIYAAAWFADLPELRELRTLFTEKFGNSLEPYISKEFVEKLRRVRPTREMKIQLLHDIAQEFSIEWYSKALEQRLSRPSPSQEERSKHDSDEKKVSKNHDRVSHKRDNLVVSESSSDGETSTDDPGRKTDSSFGDSFSEDEVESKRPFSSGLVPPPYLKPKANKDENSSKKTTEDEDSATLAEKISRYLLPEKPTAKSARRPLKPPPSATEGRVHPKLPDYDDLAAHISSLKLRGR